MSYLRGDSFLLSRNTLQKTIQYTSKSFVMIDSYCPPECYLSHKNPPLVPFLDRIITVIAIK